jgi:hypothetical protein
MGPFQVLELVKFKVVPEDNPAEEGILLEGTMSLPFTVHRSWSGNEGYYFEQILIRSGGRQVYTGPPMQIFVRGLQSITSYEDRIGDRIPLEVGSCELVFVVDDVEMDAVSVPVKALANV